MVCSSWTRSLGCGGAAALGHQGSALACRKFPLSPSEGRRPLEERGALAHGLFGGPSPRKGLEMGRGFWALGCPPSAVSTQVWGPVGRQGSGRRTTSSPGPALPFILCGHAESPLCLGASPEVWELSQVAPGAGAQLGKLGHCHRGRSTETGQGLGPRAGFKHLGGTLSLHLGRPGVGAGGRPTRVREVQMQPVC